MDNFPKEKGFYVVAIDGRRHRELLPGLWWAFLGGYLKIEFALEIHFEVHVTPCHPPLLCYNTHSGEHVKYSQSLLNDEMAFPWQKGKR